MIIRARVQLFIEVDTDRVDPEYLAGTAETGHAYVAAVVGRMENSAVDGGAQQCYVENLEVL